MDSFFKSIGLYDTLDFETEMSKSELIINLKKLVYKSDFSIFEAADYSIPNRFEYKGFVNENNFTLRRRKHFFDSKIPNSNIKGVVYEKNGKTFIKTEFIPVQYLIINLILPVLIFSALSLLINESGLLFFSIAAITITTCNYYFTTKINIKRNKYDFERELNFIAQKAISTI